MRNFRNNTLARTIMLYVLILFVVMSLTDLFTTPNDGVVDLSFSRFMEHAQAGDVAEITIQEQRGRGTLVDGTSFTVVLPGDNTWIVHLLEAQGAEVALLPPAQAPWWTSVLGSLLFVALLIAVFFFFMQRMQGSGNPLMRFGRSRARLVSGEDQKKVTFEDVAGYEEIKEELQEIVDFLKNPKRYTEVGARIPKGVLLYGPPGTGKTHIARAIAGEAGVPFYSISGSDFVEMFVGVGAARVRDMFREAKQNAPVIIFIDEIDAVGRQRGAGYGGGHDEREQTLNQLLVEMDGFGVNEGIVVIAATNRPDVLDPALLRPGRFDRQIVIDRPDLKAREQILQVHAKKKPLSDDVDLSIIARRTPGFTGADLENLLNEAALLAARRRKQRIEMVDLEDSIDRVITGGPAKKARVMSEEERRRVAYHEAGHALAGYILPHADPVHKISIIPRGRALGYVLQLPDEDRHLTTKPELLDRATMMLAGRVAEEIVFGEPTTGAQDDLERVTKLIRRMVTEFGMSPELGPRTFGTKVDAPFLGRDLARQPNYSEQVASLIDEEIDRIITRCYERATEILQKHRAELDLIAETLLEKETIDADELKALLGEEIKMKKPAESQPATRRDAPAAGTPRPATGRPLIDPA